MTAEAQRQIKEKNYWIRQRKQLLEYQIRFFTREIKKTQKSLDKLLAGTEMRAKAYGLKYESIEEIEEAYIAGLLTDEESFRQRVALWQTYSDRGKNMRLAWLNEELEKYQSQYDELLELIEKERKATQQKWGKVANKAFMKKQKKEAAARRRAKKEEAIRREAERVRREKEERKAERAK